MSLTVECPGYFFQPSTLPTGDEAYEEYDVLSDVGDTAMNLDDPVRSSG